MRTRSAGGSAAYDLSRFTPARQEARRPRLTVASPSARARARARAAYALKGVAYLISGLLYGYMGYYAVDWCIKLFKMKKSMESVNFPAYVMWIFVCIGMVTMGLRYLIETGKCARNAVTGKQEFTEVNTKEN